MFYFFVQYKTNFLESSLRLVYKFDHSITYNLVIPLLGIRAKGKIFNVYVQLGNVYKNVHTVLFLTTKNLEKNVLTRKVINYIYIMVREY